MKFIMLLASILFKVPVLLSMIVNTCKQCYKEFRHVVGISHFKLVEYQALQFTSAFNSHKLVHRTMQTLQV